MRCRRHSLLLLALSVVISLPLLASAGVAGAKAVKAAKGCHKTHTCRSHGGSGTGGPAPGPLTLQVDPNPVVETASSAIAVVLQVETSPSFAGDTVNITSSQLDATCSEFTGFIFSAARLLEVATFQAPNPLLIPLTLDDDGNAAIDLFGQDCAPGSDVLEASMAAAPYYTALTTLVANPPVVTTPGVFGFPTSSGTVAGGEVATGDSGNLVGADSNIYAVFNAETDPVYAEQSVTFTWTQLADRCLTSNAFLVLDPGGFSAVAATPGGLLTSATAQIDDDGNATVIFAGSSCAAGSSVVMADVDAGTHPTYLTTFNILPPQPTI